MPIQTDTAVGNRPFQRLKSVLRGGPLRTSVLVTSKDSQPHFSPPSPSDAGPPGALSPNLGLYEARTTEETVPPQEPLSLPPGDGSPTPRQERLSTSSRDRSRRLSSLGMSKVKALLTSSSSPGVSSPPSPRSRRSTSERTLTDLAGTRHSEEHLENDQEADKSEAAFDSTIFQLLPPDHADGVYRPGDCLTGMVTLRASPGGDRRVVSVMSTLRGVRNCHLVVPSDDSEPLYRQQEVPKRREIGFSKVEFWTDRCSLFTESDLATLSNPSDASSLAESVSAQFEFLLPKKLPATWLDDYTEDEMARPRRLRDKSRLPIDLPPSLAASSIPLGGAQREEAANMLQKASQWVQNSRSDKPRCGRIEYTIEVVVKRQRMGWTGRLGVTKKERLSTPFTVHPHPPFSATVPIAVNQVPAILPSPSTSSPAVRAGRASLSVEPSSPPGSGIAQRRRSLQVDVGSLTAPNREARLAGSPSRDLSDDNLQIVTNDRGRQQAWYKHSAVDATGGVYMELSFPALASISTDVKVPFLLRLSLPRGSRPNTETVRMSFLRTVTSTTKYGTLKIETAVPIRTPDGQAGVKVEEFSRREDPVRVRDLPHRLGAEVQVFEGAFTIEGYTVPARGSSPEGVATQGLGLLTPGTVGPGTSTLVDPSQRTVPSFTFKNLKLSYSLLVQVDIDVPSVSRAHVFEEGVGQLEIPTICVANDGAAAGGHSMASPRTEVEQLAPAEGAAAPSASQLTSTSAQPSRLQGLPTYSSLYLRDMARRAAGESSALEAAGEMEGEGDAEGDEDSSTSCETAPDGLENEQTGDSTPPASSDTAHPQSSRDVVVSPARIVSLPQAAFPAVQPAAALPLSPSPSYISQTGFPFSSMHSSDPSAQAAEGGASSHSPVQAAEEDALQVTSPAPTTSADTTDNLSDCTTDTLPPGYPMSVRTARGVGGRNEERVGGTASTTASTSAGVAAGRGSGAGGAAGSTAPALTREMRAIEAYLGARSGRLGAL